jgi:hypothetical protein
MKSRGGAKSLDVLSLHDLLCFMAGWHPPTNEFERSRSRWLTWTEYDIEYEAVRDELLASDEWAQAGTIPFAEARYRAHAEGP